MLTHTDVHLLVGMLSLITNPENVEVELGSRVLDAASGRKRDVDITVTARHPNGTVAAYAAVEVKDEAEPLGTPTVEQLIAKLRDMPSITRRSIVSASGYAAPAKAKAAFHGVELLTLREWRKGERVYPFLSPNFSAAIEVHLYGWLAPPDVVIATNTNIHRKILNSAIVLAGDGTTAILGTVIDSVVAKELSRLTDTDALSDLKHGMARPVRRELRLECPLKAVVGDQPVEIHGFDIAGNVFAARSRKTPAMKLLVNEATGGPDAACLVGIMPTGDLWGTVFTSADINPHMVRISLSDRNLKAITRLRLPPRVPRV